MIITRKSLTQLLDEAVERVKDQLRKEGSIVDFKDDDN